MIDWARVLELRDAVGADGFDEVIELFLEEVEEGIETLRTAGPDGLEEQLHFLKGSALNLGFTRFSELCAAGEKAAAEGDAEQVDLTPILHSYAASKECFITGLDRNLAA